MYNVLQLSQSTYYYEAKVVESNEGELTLLIKIFHERLQTYGACKIKIELNKSLNCFQEPDWTYSKCTIAQFKPSKSSCNKSEEVNELNREFHQDQELKVVVSDLTIVHVGQKWHYIFGDLFNREIIG